MIVPTDHHGQDLAGPGRTGQGRGRAGPDIPPQENFFNVATGNLEDITQLRNFAVTAVQRLTGVGGDSGLIGKRESYGATAVKPQLWSAQTLRSGQIVAETREVGDTSVQDNG